jgi:choline dehydrogenase-like flavoprotein
MSFLVIGSGPAGAATAHALVSAGRAVTVVDAGDTIEAGHMDVFDELARSEPASWPPGLVQRARNGFPVGVKHVPMKAAYGSLFPYALEDTDMRVRRENVDTLPSLALGGLSNAWGASMLPARAPDIARWPVSLGDLAPHYEAVLRFVPIAAERDELSESLPLYTHSPGKLERSPQAAAMLHHMRDNSDRLKAAGFSFGASRLAVTTSEQLSQRCRYSGMCLYGCPYHAIYNSSHTLQQLARGGRIVYRGGLFVDRLQADNGSIVVHAHERGRPHARTQLKASRVFVACGAVSSTRLVLDSLRSAPRARQLLDSQYFVIPAMALSKTPVSVATQGNTLAQIFVELENERILQRPAHLQIYGYNDVMLSALATRLPLRAERVERLLRPLLGRLVVIQGFLHSDDSPGLAVDLDDGDVQLLGEEQPTASTRVRRVVRHLAINARALGLTPVPGLTQYGPPGKSNHIGGSFPMRREPHELETDALGRLPQWDNVHLVDASVFPSVPATTVTLSIMANAHRIASAVADTGD